jgi:hypothetical protein
LAEIAARGFYAGVRLFRGPKVGSKKQGVFIPRAALLQFLLLACPLHFSIFIAIGCAGQPFFVFTLSIFSAKIIKIMGA